MRHHGKMLRQLALALVTCTGLALTAHAAPLPAPGGFPAPGGTTFSSSGSLIGDGFSNNDVGRTRTYSGFDLSGGSFSQLYWNLTGGTFDGLTPWSNIVGSTTNLSLIGTGPSDITYYLAQTWSFFDPAISQVINANVRLKTVFTDMFGNGITGHFVNNFSAGLPSILFSMSTADLTTWGGGFKVSQIYETTAGVDAGVWFNTHNGGGGLNSSTSGAFWYDPPVQGTPAPGALLLLALGLAAFGLRRRA
jgi:hypothetical protein